MKRLALVLALLAAPALAQTSGRSYVPRTYSAASMPTCGASESGWVVEVYDAADAEDCGTGSGTHDHSCQCNGSAWVALARRDEVPDGSGTATQIAYWSDTDTLTSASSAVIESGAGANTLVVDSATRIGMGTAAPSVDLHLTRTGAVTFLAESTGGANNAFFQLVNTAQTWNIGNTSTALVLNSTGTAGNDVVIEDSSAANSLYIKSNGAVGLGTASPSVRLHAEDTAIDGDLRRIKDSDGDCTENPESGAITDTCTSSAKTKKNIRPADKAKLWQRLKDFPMREYETEATNETKVGVVAEDLLLVLPGYVVERPEREICTTDEAGVETCIVEPAHLAVTVPTVWELLAVIQDLQQRVEKLEKDKARRGILRRVFGRRGS